MLRNIFLKSHDSPIELSKPGLDLFLTSAHSLLPSEPHGFPFCHFFSGNVIKELGVGCFMHKYSDSLLAINGCRFYYLSGFQFYYLL